jgi:hypothetical protein
MAQKIIVQGGVVSYSNSDPSLDLNLNVAGIINVTKELNVGDNLLAGGTITTPPGQDMHVMTGNAGAFKVENTGPIILHNVSWPDGTVTPVPGMVIGVSALNTLQFMVGGAGATTLDQLTDVTITAVADNNLLSYDSGTGQWVNKPLGLIPVNNI